MANANLDITSGSRQIHISGEIPDDIAMQMTEQVFALIQESHRNPVEEESGDAPPA